jgi:cysteine sulfinate desulfinase/cysteine desulfurase-like protein
MGLTSDEARATVRFSLSRMNTEEEIDRAIDVVRDVVPRCRK